MRFLIQSTPSTTEPSQGAEVDFHIHLVELEEEHSIRALSGSQFEIVSSDGTSFTSDEAIRIGKLRFIEKESSFLGALASFVRRIDEIYGLYLDAAEGFTALRVKIGQAQATASGIFGKSIQQLDELPHIFGRGDPNDPANEQEHRTTQGQLKARNAVDGANARKLSQYFLVLVFHLWEQEYRPMLADALGCEANTVVVPIMGDIRRLRNEILKHRAILTAETQRKLTEFPELVAGTEIYLDGAAMARLVRKLKDAIDTLAKERRGVDPNFRAPKRTA